MHRLPRYNIILDCLGVRRGELRGGDRYITGIIAELAASGNRDFFLIVNKTWAGFIENVLPPSQYAIVPISARFRTFRMLVQMVLGPFIARRYRASIYVSTAVFPTLGFPCPTSAFVHDLLIYHFPELFNRAEWLIRTTILNTSVPTLSAVFTSSKASAADLKNRFRRDERSLHVISGAAHDRVAPPLSSPEREQVVLEELGLKDRKFVLSILGALPYKNQRGLAEAANKLIEWGRDDLDLIVVGDAIRVFETMTYPKSLRPLGFVSDDILAILYANASAMVFPTFFEGFGLPVIEAQAAGLPVICSDIGVLREVGGEGAIFVDPHSADSMARAIVNVVDSPQLQQALIESGKENARQFTWRRAADMFLAACRAVVKEVGVEHPLEATRTAAPSDSSGPSETGAGSS